MVDAGAAVVAIMGESFIDFIVFSPHNPLIARKYSLVSSDTINMERPWRNIPSRVPILSPKPLRFHTASARQQTPFASLGQLSLSSSLPRGTRRLRRLLLLVVIVCASVWFFSFVFDRAPFVAPLVDVVADENDLDSPTVKEVPTAVITTGRSRPTRRVHVPQPRARRCPYDPDFPYGIQLGFVPGTSFSGYDAWNENQVGPMSGGKKGD